MGRTKVSNVDLEKRFNINRNGEDYLDELGISIKEPVRNEPFRGDFE
jgi:hypothetical protein